MQKLFSLNELIDASKNQLNIHTIKDYCRRGELHPCVYFEGNIVCIHDERFQNSITKYDPVAHIETVSWTRKFKGYIFASNFIDYIGYTDPNTFDVFFNIEKIIEHIPSINDFPTLQKDEYLKAFPPLIDDDIQEKRWLYEIKDFKGNVFKANEIVFHISEVEKLLLQLNGPSKNPIKLLNHSDKTFLSSILNKEAFTALEAACLMTGDNPQALELLKENNLENYQKHYPENEKALNLILRAVEMNVLEMKDNLIDELLLKEFLVTRGYIIEKFNKSSYEGNHVMYTPLMRLGNHEPRPIPSVIDFSVMEDPLSEDNYRVFKVKKLQEEYGNLLNKLHLTEQENKALKERIKPTDRNNESYEVLSGLQRKNQFNKDKQGMMRIIAKYLYSLEQNSDLKPIDIAKKVYQEMLNYVDKEDLPQNLETIKRYISDEIPSKNKKPGRPKTKI
ncbi:TPA: hypothetical protein ACGIJT_002777 [Acinetobacter baumannii]|uniref:hypothetical protein n=2 Tax=Acinetobacter baumannii TaxID=470 RepID=UPI001D1771EE|nr:hypothetical protein [Acinetobacter baumannii]